MTLFKTQTWSRAAFLAVPVLCAQVAVSQLQADFGVQAFGAALAQEQQAKKKEQATRRTPALRNKVYEKLAEAQAAAEAKDLNLAAQLLDDMLRRGKAGSKNELNSYELANVYNLYALSTTPAKTTARR
jgi:Skp family chaperone for outer membrane proteins